MGSIKYAIQYPADFRLEKLRGYLAPRSKASAISVRLRPPTKRQCWSQGKNKETQKAQRENQKMPEGHGKAWPTYLGLWQCAARPSASGDRPRWFRRKPKAVLQITSFQQTGGLEPGGLVVGGGSSHLPMNQVQMPKPPIQTTN